MRSVVSNRRAAARHVAAIIMGAALSINAMAQNLGTIFTDLWWNPLESGWGVTVDHQQNYMFLTFFVYRADGSPYWVTANLTKVGQSGLATFPQVFEGPVYETNGPWLGGPFNPAAVTRQTVGVATFTANSSFAAIVQYGVNGVTVTKSIQRQTLVDVNYSGQYVGGTYYMTGNCANPANNNVAYQNSGLLTINHSGTSFQVSVQGQTTSCDFDGSYSQQGSIGSASGTYSCADGSIGTFAMPFVQWTAFGMTAALTGQNQQACQFNGYLGGISGDHVAP